MSVAAFREYRDALNRKLATGQASERTHYPALQRLLEAIGPALTVTNEPLRIQVGAPDFILTSAQTPIGYVECKDVGAPLDPVEGTDQLKRYFSLPNLILTNYLEFRWYAEGAWRATAHLGRQDPEGKVHLTGEGAAEVEELLSEFFAYQVVTIGTAEELAERLARLTQLLHDLILGSFRQDEKPLESLRETFSETLLPDLSEEVFADMYAQTLAYGLFSACFELRRPLGRTGVSPVRKEDRSGETPDLPPEKEASGETPDLPGGADMSGETPDVPPDVPPDLPGGYYALPRILHSIKSFTAHEINSRRGTNGPIWVEESFDRIVRNQEEFDEKLCYMLNNTVKAGIVKDGWAYPFFWVEAMGRTGVSPVTEEKRSGETPDVPPDLPGTFGPEDVFYYAYAVFHSPTYRERYAEFLKIDFPRLPLTSDRELFAALVDKGKRLVDLHLMREEGHIGPRPRFEGEGDNVVEKVRYVEEMTGETPVLPGRVYINPKQYFSGVEPEVWEFHIGGYQVCEKWLKDRKGRELSYEDIAHYQSIVLALRETRRLMQEIDETISRWPIE